MKKSVLTLVFLITWLTSFSQETSSTVSDRHTYLQLLYHTGIYWTRTEYLTEQFADGYKAIEARFGFQTTGRKAWQQYHHYPRYGFGFHYADLVADREDTIVGNPFSAFVFYSAPWARFGRFTLNTDIALGLSYTSVIHDPVSNPINDVIASYLNLYFDFNLNIYYALTNRIDISAGYGVTHYSNGSMHQPQKGVNNWGWNLGLSYNFSDQPKSTDLNDPDGKSYIRPEFIESEKPTFIYSEVIQLMYAAGVVERHILGELEGTYYFTSSFTVDYAVTLNPRMAVTIGMDVLYNGSLKMAIKGVDPEDVTTIQKMSVGSHLGYHFLIDRLTILFNLGTYFFQHSNDKGYWFIRAGGRFRITDHFHTQICIKAKDGIRADWIEWGLAYSLKIR
ncbi:MAG: acyloxyacyl hydrolase [Bacteroidales bacterium]|nr:acyloxyacyl hydrolase [Bacteroidales bacterium]